MEFLIKISTLDPSNNWKFLDKQGSYTVHIKDEGGKNYSRGEGIIEFSPNQIMDYVADFELRKTYDEIYILFKLSLKID